MLGEKEGLPGVRGVSALPLLLLALSPLLSLELRRELLGAGEGLALTEGLLSGLGSVG